MTDHDKGHGGSRLIAIKRLGSKVMLEFSCSDAAAARQFAYEFASQLQSRSLRLDLWSGPER